MCVDRRPVAAHRRRLAAAVVLDVAQVLGGRVGERCPGPHHPRQRPTTRLIKHVSQPVLGQALGEVPGRRPSAIGPGRPELLLDLAPVGEAVLGVPDRSACPLDAEDMTGGRTQLARHLAEPTPISGHIGDMFRSWNMS